MCVLVVVAIVACKSSEQKPEAKPAAAKTAPQGKGPAVGQTVQLGQIKREPGQVSIAIIVPAEQDIGKLEQNARDVAVPAKLTLTVSRGKAKDLGLDRERAGWMLGGVPDADFDAIERANVLLLDVTKPTNFAGVRELLTISSVLANRARGWVLDPSVGGLWTADAFTKRLPDKADARDLIAVHAISGDEVQPYLDTMGMARLGLPELYVAAVAPGQIEPVTQLINATAQTLLARGDISRPGELDVDLAGFDPSWELDAIKKAGGTGRVTWRLEWSRGEHDEGSDEKLHIALIPIKGSGPEGIAMMLDTFFGDVPDKVYDIADDDPDILAAGKRARADLVAMRPQFAKGVPVGEELIVKAPFKTPDDRIEWMWVGVVKWRGEQITGNLDNDPKFIPTLKLGERVTVKLGEVSDYLHTDKDGNQKGGYSIEVFRKRGIIP